LRIGGLRYFAATEQEVRVKLCHFVGRRLGDVLPELRIAETSAEWWEAELTSRNVRIESAVESKSEIAPATADYMVCDGDVALLRVHAHDRVVADVQPVVLHDDADVLAVCKPAGLEIFSNKLGGSMRSSMMGMLDELGYTGVAPVHRIDKPVSGVVVLSKNKKSASRLTRCVQAHKFRKTYLARVCAPNGPPREGFEVTEPLSVHTDSATAYVDPMGKPATTVVRHVLRHFEEDGTAVIVV